MTAAERPDARGLYVLVVDDSAVVRTAMMAILSKEPGIVVATAADAFIALQRIAQRRPDVIVLDLEMPRMDGLTFLARLMAEDPIPVVVCSGMAGPRTEPALRAIELGAVDIVQKPQIGVREFLEDSAIMLIDAVRGAALSRARRKAGRGAWTPAAASAALRPKGAAEAAIAAGATASVGTVVALGASTGGTEALRHILEAMPADGPAMVIVQHMPELFTKAFAEHLDRSCTLEVKEASDGDRVIAGRALIAAGNKHMRLVRSGGRYVVRVTGGELVSRHRPSVDVLFHSVAQAAGPGAIGVIMTGMGADGADGLADMRRAGALTLAQDEASCVVFGMPKEAIARGAVCEVASLAHLPAIILQRTKR